MTDWSRLTGYIIDYFPEPKYSRQDIRDWAQGSVPAWKYMGNKDKDEILQDWEDFVFEKEVEPEIKALVKGKSAGFLTRAIKRIKEFLGRLF